MSRDALPPLAGLLAIDKPIGLTSHDVVARVRRLVGMKRVGHGGTLDPFASGVLIVAVGQATRVLQHVQHGNKRYLAHVVLGVETDSHDVDGEVVARRRVERWPTMDEVKAACERLTGDIEQVPPRHSAIKVEGRKLYERARAGEAFDVPPRSVAVHAIDVLWHEPPDVYLAVHCGSGTYIRSLARDLGAMLGVGAYCHGLSRYESGAIRLCDCWRLEDLESIDVRLAWPTVALHPDAALRHLGAVVLGGDESVAWYHGRSIQPAMATPDAQAATVRVYDALGGFLGIGALDDDGRLRPSVVFAKSDPGSAEDEDTHP